MLGMRFECGMPNCPLPLVPADQMLVPPPYELRMLTRPRTRTQRPPCGRFKVLTVTAGTYLEAAEKAAAAAAAAALAASQPKQPEPDGKGRDLKQSMSIKKPAPAAAIKGKGAVAAPVTPALEPEGAELVDK